MDAIYRKNVNEEKYHNEKIINYCWEGLGLWVWRESDFTKAEEVEEFVQDKIYGELYEKIINYWNKEDKL